MQRTQASPPSARPPLTRRPAAARRLPTVALGICVVALLIVLATMLLTVFLPTIAPASTRPFIPTADDGYLPDDAVVTLADDGVPAIARLDPALIAALRDAESDAGADGLVFEVTSGWRSAEYQQWLLEDAIQLYKSEAVARQFVAPPDRSRHVTGDAIDIGPVDAQFWLIENGSRCGICQTYANERWHFELATEPGGVCPPMREDAAS